MTDFRHLNTRITKNNLAYPLIRDMFAMLGNSKCDVLSILDFERCISLLEVVRKSKVILWYLTILWKCLIFIPENAYGTKCLSTNLANIHKHHSLNCMEGRKYYEAIMDDLLLFTPSKQSHMTKLERFIKGIT